MNNGLERLGILSIDDVRKLYKEARRTKSRYLEVNGVVIKMSSQRYVVFLETSGTKCIHCGLRGEYFAVERQKEGCEHYFLNLYGRDKKRREILMTKDHRYPKSKGGRNTIDNYDTLCQRCNSSKGDKLDAELITVA